MQNEPPCDASLDERLRLLRGRPFLRGLDHAVVRELAEAFDSVHVRGGDLLYERGQANVPLLLVVHGGLRTSFLDPEGARHVVLEFFRGGSIGEALLLSDCASPFDVHAIRDSHLLSLAPDRFRALMTRHPQLMLGCAREVATRVVDLFRLKEFLSAFTSQADRLPRSIVLLSAGGPDADRMQDELGYALAGSCLSARLRSADARAVMRSTHDPEHELQVRLAEWLSRHEVKSELVVFECGADDGAWVDFSLRQADRVMVLAEDGVDRRALERRVWEKASLGDRPARVELAIVHEASTSLPHGGAAYLGLPGLARLHHVRAGARSDGERLARWMLD